MKFAVWMAGAALLVPAQEPPTFRTATKLVEFTVVVLDKQGNPVTDLRREDFSVADNGQERELSFFRYEGGPAARGAAPLPAPAGFFTNRGAAEAPRNVTALVLDTLNTSVRDQMMVKAQAARFLNYMAPETRVALYELGTEFHVLHDLTSDMESLREQLKQLKVSMQLSQTADIGQMSREAEATMNMLRGNRKQYSAAYLDAIERMLKVQIAGEMNVNARIRDARLQNTLATLETLGRHMAQIAGRKSLIWISGGVAMVNSEVSTDARRAGRINPASGRDYQEALRASARRLAQAGVTLYSVDARGLTSSAENFAEERYMRAFNSDLSNMEQAEAMTSDPRAAFALMTSVTGGRSFHFLNDFTEAIRRASNDQQGSYSIGFYTPESDGKWHTLKASVKRPGLTLLHRQGYLAEAAPGGGSEADMLSRAMMDPALATGIRLYARFDAPAQRLELRIEPEDLKLEDGRGEVTLVIGEKTVDGKIRFEQSSLKLNLSPAQLAAFKKDGIPYRGALHPGPDTMTVRILTRDPATGKMGSVDVPVSR